MATKLGEFPLVTVGKVGVVAASDGGESSGDVAVKLGTTIDDGALNAGAKLFTICTGIDGEEIEKVYVDRAGNLVIDGSITASNISGSVGTVTSVSVTTADGVSGSVATATTTPAITVVLGDIKPTSVDTATLKNSGTILEYSTAQGDVSGEIATKLGTNISTASSAAEAVLTSFDTGINGTGGHSFARVSARGRIDQYGKDGSGSPGNITQDSPIGIATMATGSASITVTNSLVLSTSVVFVTWLKEPPGLWWVEITTGSFTMNCAASAGGNIQFCWEVKSMLTGPV